MWFWWFMLCCDILIPVVMIFAGQMMRKHPPEKINSIIGYRSARSMKNTDTWTFAHNYSGSLWWKTGWMMLLPSIIVCIPVYGQTDDRIGILGVILTTVQIIVLISTVFSTERALKRTFTDEGIRK